MHGGRSVLPLLEKLHDKSRRRLGHREKMWIGQGIFLARMQAACASGLPVLSTARRSVVSVLHGSVVAIQSQIRTGSWQRPFGSPRACREALSTSSPHLNFQPWHWMGQTMYSASGSGPSNRECALTANCRLEKDFRVGVWDPATSVTWSFSDAGLWGM